MNYKLVVLGLLAKGPQYGYQIKAYIHDSFSSTIAVNNNTIYPLLRGFVKDGFATKERQHVQGAPDRQVYTITDAGRDELARMIAALPETDVANQDDFMIACTFVPQMQPQDQERLFDKREARVRAALKDMGRSSASSAIQQLQREFGAHSLKAELDFIDKLRRLAREQRG